MLWDAVRESQGQQTGRAGSNWQFETAFIQKAVRGGHHFLLPQLGAARVWVAQLVGKECAIFGHEIFSLLAIQKRSRPVLKILPLS